MRHCSILEFIELCCTGLFTSDCFVGASFVAVLGQILSLRLNYPKDRPVLARFSDNGKDQ